ncbi:MAG: RusA family crossover junction endodeoxyribonuclease [Phycisphaerales bacterium]|nr:RusA family crossover junction endodeoxyribonuclease [Phycisphaerales bacterium]
MGELFAADSDWPSRIVITAPGLPVAQARHRDRVIQAKSGRAFVQRYTPKETLAWRRNVLLAARQTSGYPSEPWAGAVRLSMEAFFDRPQRLMTRSSPAGAIRKNTTPDSDNLVKAVMDALTPPKLKLTGNQAIDEAARLENLRGYLWIDDGQVHLGPVDRWYAAMGCGPGVIITVERIPEGE